MKIKQIIILIGVSIIVIMGIFPPWIAKGEEFKDTPLQTIINAHVYKGNVFLSMNYCAEAREEFYKALDLMNVIHGDDKRTFFSNSDTEVVNTIRDAKYEVVVQIP